MKTLIRFLNLVLALSLLATAGCEKIPVTNPEDIKPLEVTLEPNTVVLPYMYPVDVKVVFDNVKDRYVNVTFSGLPQLVHGEFISTAFGGGTLRLMSSSDVNGTYDVKVNFENQGKTCTATLKVIVQGPADLAFEDGTTSKTYNILEYERCIDLVVATTGEGLEVNTESNIDWEVISSPTGMKIVRLMVPENSGRETITKRLSITVPGSTKSLSLTLYQKGKTEAGSMYKILCEFFDATEGNTAWAGMKTSGWKSEKPLHEWSGVSSVFVEDVLFKGQRKTVYTGVVDLWNIDRGYCYLGGKIPQVFWDNFKYIGYLNLDGCLNCELNDTKEQYESNVIGQINYSYILPDNVFHENLIGISLDWFSLRNDNLERFYDCPYLQVLRWGWGSTAKFNVDDRMLNWKNLQTFVVRNVTGTIPQNIGTLTNLSEFSVRIDDYIFISEGLTGQFPESIYNLEKLTWLEIEGPITGQLDSRVSNWEALEKFDLIGTKMSGKIPEEFGMLKNLKHLGLNDNHFSIESIPEFYRYWPSQRGNWQYGTFDMDPIAKYQWNNNDENIVVGTPKWVQEKFGVKDLQYIIDELEFNYPYAKDLEYPAYEYYYDGKDWRHPKYQYPARYYHEVNGKWIYDKDWDWNEIVVPPHSSKI